MTADTAAARENARRKDGTFGHQSHPEAEQLADLAPATFSPWSLDDDPVAFAGLEAADVRAYAAGGWGKDHGGVLHDVPSRHIELALFEHLSQFNDLADAAAADDQLDKSARGARIAEGGRLLDSVVAEAVRRDAAQKSLFADATRTDNGTFVGANHTGYRDAAAIAADVRSTIKRAYELNLLPQGTTVSVRTSKFAGGASITATVHGMPDALALRQDRDYGGSTYSEYARNVMGQLDAILTAHNRQQIDTMSDYWNVDFYGHSRIESESEAKAVAREKQRRAALRTARQARSA